MTTLKRVGAGSGAVLQDLRGESTFLPLRQLRLPAEGGCTPELGLQGWIGNLHRHQSHPKAIGV